VEDAEEVAAVAVLGGIGVDLRPLAAGEDVLDVEGVPAEPTGEKLRLARGRREEVDPGDPAGAKLSRPRPRLDDRSSGHGATRADARQAGHRY
jgi:hypothetical protein